MVVRKMGFVRGKLGNQALKLYKRLENLDNSDSSKNGETAFLKSFLSSRPAGRAVVIFDCGAHHGAWTAACLQAIDSGRASLHLFEPSQSSFEILRKQFGQNGNITINNAGVSDASGTRVLYADRDGSSLSSLYRRRVSVDNVLQERGTVNLIRLEDYLVDKGIRHIDLIKLDIEGHELAALQGLGKYLAPDAVDAIQFEYGGANVDSGARLSDFYAFLRPSGYLIHKMMRTHIEPRDYSPSMENYMYSNYVALSPVAARGMA